MLTMHRRCRFLRRGDGVYSVAGVATCDPVVRLLHKAGQRPLRDEVGRPGGGVGPSFPDERQAPAVPHDDQQVVVLHGKGREYEAVVEVEEQAARQAQSRSVRGHLFTLHTHSPYICCIMVMVPCTPQQDDPYIDCIMVMVPCTHQQDNICKLYNGHGTLTHQQDNLCKLCNGHGTPHTPTGQSISCTRHPYPAHANRTISIV